MLEETRPDHVIFSSVIATKLPLCCIIWKKNKSEICGFLKFVVLLNF